MQLNFEISDLISKYPQVKFVENDLEKVATSRRIASVWVVISMAVAIFILRAMLHGHDIAGLPFLHQYHVLYVVGLGEHVHWLNLESFIAMSLQ